MRSNEPGIFARSLEGDVASNPEERLVPPSAEVVWGLTVSPDEPQLLFGVPEPGADLVLLEFR